MRNINIVFLILAFGRATPRPQIPFFYVVGDPFKDIVYHHEEVEKKGLEGWVWVDTPYDDKDEIEARQSKALGDENVDFFRPSDGTRPLPRPLAAQARQAGPEKSVDFFRPADGARPLQRPFSSNSRTTTTSPFALRGSFAAKPSQSTSPVTTIGFQNNGKFDVVVPQSESEDETRFVKLLVNDAPEPIPEARSDQGPAEKDQQTNVRGFFSSQDGKSDNDDDKEESVDYFRPIDGVRLFPRPGSRSGPKRKKINALEANFKPVQNEEDDYEYGDLLPNFVPWKTNLFSDNFEPFFPPKDENSSSVKDEERSKTGKRINFVNPVVKKWFRVGKMARGNREDRQFFGTVNKAGPPFFLNFRIFPTPGSTQTVAKRKYYDEANDIGEDVTGVGSFVAASFEESEYDNDEPNTDDIFHESLVGENSVKTDDAKMNEVKINSSTEKEKQTKKTTTVKSIYDELSNLIPEEPEPKPASSTVLDDDDVTTPYDLIDAQSEESGEESEDYEAVIESRSLRNGKKLSDDAVVFEPSQFIDYQDDNESDLDYPEPDIPDLSDNNLIARQSTSARPVIVNTSSVGDKEFECSGDGMRYFSDSSSCRVYHVCMPYPGRGGYQHWQFECGPGTVFSPTQLACVHGNSDTCNQSA